MDADRSNGDFDQGAVSLTLLIATRNRATELRRTLESICTPANLQLPAWEILVADNGSTDGTRAVCQHFHDRCPSHFRWIVERNQGKSRALNAGLLKSRGTVLVMTDDDVLCAPDLLERVRELFADPSIDAAQGRIFIDWIGGRPEWVDDLSAALLSLRDYGDRQFDWHKDLSGCNMMVRRRAALAIGGFAAELGPGTVGIAEDAEFSMRLRQSGYRMVYAPHVVVRHQVRAARVSRRFLRQRFFGIGRSYSYYMPLSAPIWRAGLYFAKETIKAEAKALAHRFGGRPADAMRAQCESRQGLGLVWQYLLFRLGRATRTLTYIPEEQRTSAS